MSADGRTPTRLIHVTGLFVLCGAAPAPSTGSVSTPGGLARGRGGARPTPDPHTASAEPRCSSAPGETKQTRRRNAGGLRCFKRLFTLRLTASDLHPFRAASIFTTVSRSLWPTLLCHVSHRSRHSLIQIRSVQTHREMIRKSLTCQGREVKGLFTETF